MHLYAYLMMPRLATMQRRVLCIHVCCFTHDALKHSLSQAKHARPQPHSTSIDCEAVQVSTGTESQIIIPIELVLSQDIMLQITSQK